jgi:hypothetical protein
MNEAPRRLIDDPEVSGSLRDDLARAGEEHHASAAAYDTASRLAGLQVALASQGGGSAGMGLLLKLGLGTVAAAALMFAGAALHARFYARGQAVDRAAVAAPTPVAPAAPLHVVQAPQVTAPQAAGPTAPADAPVQATSSSARRAQHDDTPREIRQLARIRAHLQSGDAASALELADRGQRELGESTLWQEREALAVLALFDLGRAEQAQARSAVLLARFPNSPFRAELEHRSRRAHER